LVTHEIYIKRCLQLGKRGVGTTRPNPSVGAVIVYNDKIIGEGYTSPYGGSHAEVNAVASVVDKSLLSKSTMYVTLEPCSHFGKTPPCADLIIKNKIPNVVVGIVDSNSLVCGQGIKRLKDAGCNVTVGVLEEECKQHHKRFFAVQNKKRPYVILKWAETTNGFIAPESKNTQAPVWISNTYSKQLVHKWRGEEHAILVGTNTVLADNPKLDVRTWTGNNPVRIVLDCNLRVPDSLHVYNDAVKTIFIIDETTAIFKSELQNTFFEKIDFSRNVASQVCSVLQVHKIQSVIIEGGAKTLQTFIDENLWDEARIFIGKNEFENGVVSPNISASLVSEENIQGDILKILIND